MIWTVKYPWIKNPADLPNNYYSVFARLKTRENRLRKKGSTYAAEYDKQITDMVDRGAAEQLSGAELQGYDGSIFYIPHHEVIKSSSISTPMRIVFNSSASFKGCVINDYWAKGPSVMNDMLGILIRFRQSVVAIAGDIRKMYNSVLLDHLDQHTHRFLWRIAAGMQIIIR